jgi:hypothetical protein
MSKLTMDQRFELPEREQQLQGIADVIEYWLTWNQEVRDVEKLETTADTHIIMAGGCSPPGWPSVGQLRRWLEVLRDHG